MLNFANILDAIAGRKYYGNWTKNEKNDHVRSHSEAQKIGKSIHFDPRFLESQGLIQKRLIFANKSIYFYSCAT